MQIRPFDESDRATVIELWRTTELTRPWNDPDRDIDRKLSTDPEHFLVGTLNDQLVATVMIGYDGHRGWINYLAVAPQHQKNGFGRQIIEHAENILREIGCPKVNLQIRSSNSSAIAFYERIGFQNDDVVSYGKRLIEDDPLIYKLTLQDDWDLARTQGEFRGAGIDLNDGFIHLSTRQQVVKTAALYFAAETNLVLLSVSTRSVGDNLRWEPSRDGDLFPHLYATIPIDAIKAADPLTLDKNGIHRFPKSFRS